MKRMRAVESDSVKLARKAKDKLHKACERASETHSLVPGRSRLQFLIACSIKTEGKAWEKESHA